jgi:hypothetical protein
MAMLKPVSSVENELKLGETPNNAAWQVILITL